ncbi:MAG: glycosyltransferase family 4 protein [Candidatus Devosia euplotis]|nr:glycosyltransferase family 4 protein [Candidatus Devosia euplotis]
MAGRKLRILQIMRAPVGGLFRHVADLTRAPSANGHDVGLVFDSLANDAQTESLLAQLLPSASLGIYRFGMPRVLGGSDPATPLVVRKLQRSLNIDILHGHGDKGGFYARLARLGSSRPEIVYAPMAARCISTGHHCRSGRSQARAYPDATDRRDRA